MSEGMVFVQTNEEHNAVVVFRRAPDGSLARVGMIETGGAGANEPHLPSQGSVTLTSGGKHLLVTNAASGDVSMFAVVPGADPTVIGRARSGSVPRSVAERDGVVYVLNTGTAALVGFRLTESEMEPLADGRDYALSGPGADPAQVGISPDGSAVVVTERGTNAITAFGVQADGSLGSRHTVAASGQTPYGFDFTRSGTLVVTEAFGAKKGAAATSSYRVVGTDITAATKSLGSGRSEICWAVVTPDDRYAYTTNFADGAVSCYAIGNDARLELVDAAAGITVDGRPGLRDEALAGAGRFLYALDTDAGSIFGWSVGEGGRLSPIGSWDGLPATAAGLAAS